MKWIQIFLLTMILLKIAWEDAKTRHIRGRLETTVEVECQGNVFQAKGKRIQKKLLNLGGTKDAATQ